MKHYKLQYYQNSRIKWHWKVVADNGKLIAFSKKSYEDVLDCENDARELSVELYNNFKGDVSTFKLFRNWRLQWRWKIICNGVNIGSSSEGYWNKYDCEYNARILSESLWYNFNKKIENANQHS